MIGVKKLLDFNADFVAQKHHLEDRINKFTKQPYKFLNYHRVLLYDSANLLFSLELNGKEIAVSPKVEYQHVSPATAKGQDLMTIDQYLSSLSI